MTHFNPQDLSLEEQEEMAAIEGGIFQPVADMEAAKGQALESARATLKKTRNINIRLTERDLHKLKIKAIEEGIPYQTLAASILHKATTEKH